MSLSTLIQSIDGWQSKTAAELAATLNAETVEVRDGTLYTGKYLATILSLDDYRLVARTVAAAAQADPLVADAQGWLRGTGIDFSDPNSQSLIDALAAAGGWPDALKTTVKAIGIRFVSPYVNDGGSGTVDEATVQGAKDSLVLAARIINATALANERLPTAADQAAAWAQCWEDAV